MLWGVNHLAFFSISERILLLLLAVFLVVPFFRSLYTRVCENAFERCERSAAVRLLFSFSLGVAAALLCFYFRISTDMYGDTRTLLQFLADYRYTVLNLFDPRDTEPLTRIIHQLIAGWSGIDHKLTFQILSALSGGMMIFVLFFWVVSLDVSNTWKLFMFLAISTTGANQLFFGHVEDYTLAYLCLLFFLLTAWRLFDGKKVLGLMAVLLIVGVRLHVVFALILPSFLFAVCWVMRERFTWMRRCMQPTSVLKMLGATALFCAVAYFFYFHADHYQVGDKDEISKKIFLPVSNYHPAPHSYSLLSWKHISDVFEEMVMTVSPAVFIVFLPGLLLWRRIRWDDPRVLFYGIGSVTFTAFTFTVNPMLTMMRDWDLFSLAAAPLTFLVIAIAFQLFAGTEQIRHQRLMLGATISMGILSMAIILVNADTDRVSRRLEGIGTWAFHSYYAGSSYILNVAAKMTTSIDHQIERRGRKIRELEPYGSNRDLELGILYQKLGDAALSDKRFALAADNYSRAYANDSLNASALRSLGLIFLLTRQYDKANQLLEYYNANVNTPLVMDERGLLLAKQLKAIQLLEAGKPDSSIIQKTLDDIYQQNR